MMMRPEQRRISRLRLQMKNHDISSLLISRREDVRYLSGFTGSAGSLLITASRSFLVTDFRYQLQARLETKGCTILIQKKDIVAALYEAAERLNVDEIWFDESAVTVQERKKLRKLGLVLKGHEDIVGVLRVQKDGHEIKSLNVAIRRAEQAFRDLKRYIKPGAREQELGLRLEFGMRENGSRKVAFDTIVASGANGAMPHASVTNRRIRKGDLVTFDFGAEANGYYSDITRTICVGRPSARQQEIHDLVLKAQAAAIKSIRPGISCKSVDDAARTIIQSAGHGKHFGHGTGHGVGLMVHEGPVISPRSKDQVETDMVFTVEPGVYLPGWGGVRIEDMVLVTRTGGKLLTSLPRGLESLMDL
jgi:Xaa-Pro aminopeptidase